MRIALDAMGTDRHPAVEVEGAVQALLELPHDFDIALVGDGEAKLMLLSAARSAPRSQG